MQRQTDSDFNTVTGNTASDQPYNTSSTDTTATRQPFDQSLRQESYTNDTDRSFPLAGGVASKHDPTSRYTEHTSSSTHPTQSTSSTHQPLTNAREPGTKEKEIGVKDDYGREGLTGAAAAATGLSAGAALSQSQQRDVQSQGQETRHATYGDQPSTLSSTVSTPLNFDELAGSNHLPSAHLKIDPRDSRAYLE